jgi:hypothetical protein
MEERQMQTKFECKRRTAVEAVSYLKHRYQEQCVIFPMMREIPEALYVSRNLRAALSYYVPLDESSKRRRRCEECENWADPPSRLCPGCEAYQEHTS